MVVLDTSIVVAWTMPDEDDPLAEGVINSLASAPAITTDLFWHEVRNVLLVNVRRGRIPKDQMLRFVEALRALPIRSLEQTDDRSILTIAEKQSLSAYDAAYLALAKAHELPLATLDKRLAAAAGKVGVALWRTDNV